MSAPAAPIALAVHGGAGSRPGRDYGREIAHMRDVVALGRDALGSGMAALDAVELCVRELERSGLYVAGRGASPNAEGAYELDAGLMDGATGRAGAVAALVGFESPIAAARAVMERTPHVMLAGAGAAAFAREAGLAEVADPHGWHTRAGADESNHAPGAAALAHGTVGCVARDGAGRLAAATSTGGVFDKRPGRVGDTPVPGAGVWADGWAAVSCTGQGEFFLRTAAAASVAHRMRWGGQPLDAAAREAVEAVAALGGEGGLIAVGREGPATCLFRSAGMKRAALRDDGSILSEAF